MYATSRYIKEVAQKTPNAVQIEIQAREEDLRRSLEKTLRHGYLLSKKPDLLDQASKVVLRLAKGVYVLESVLSTRTGSCCATLPRTDAFTDSFWQYSMQSTWLVCD